MVAALHLPEETFTLHLLLERLQRLVDVVVADNDLNDFELSIGCPAGPGTNAEMPKEPVSLPLGMRWPVRRVICLPHDGQAALGYHRCRPQTTCIGAGKTGETDPEYGIPERSRRPQRPVS
jgi:hypothetical protein